MYKSIKKMLLFLPELQRSFDKDSQNNLVSVSGWNRNASEETILAYKLLVQTGDVNNPINKDQVTEPVEKTLKKQT